MNSEKILIASRMETPDGTILWSKHQHDFVSHIDAVTGETYILDGGREYKRHSVNKVPMKDVSIYSTDPFEVKRQYILRGTFDSDGNRIFKPLCKLSNAHLTNIIDYNEANGNAGCWFNSMCLRELIYRKENGIEIKDNWTPKN